MAEVSVIIPVYNGEKYIAQTLESVLAQTYQDFEIIVVDDGSIDGSADVIRNYTAKYSGKIRYFHQENRGIAAARNAGIKESRGAYIAFLDQDDLWLPDKLQKQINYFDNNKDAGLVYAHSIEFGDRSKNVPTAHHEGFILDKLIWGNFIPALSVMVKKEVFNEVGLFDENRALMGCDDFDMWLRIAARYRVGHVDYELVRWRASSAGYTYKNREKFSDAQLAVVKKNVSFLRNAVKDYDKLKSDILWSYYYRQGWSFFYNGNFQKARERFFEAFSRKPFNAKSALYYAVSVLFTVADSYVKKLKKRYWFFRMVSLPVYIDYVRSLPWALIHGTRLSASPIFILGLHRSGTSMLTGVLNICGVFLGKQDSMYGPDINNPKGYFENRKVIAINEMILDHYGLAWDSLEGLPRNWQNSLFSKWLGSITMTILNREFHDIQVWGVKDPRICLTLKFWERLFPDMKIVMVERDINEVIHSLDKRQSSPPDSKRLVEHYLSELAANLAGKRVITIKFSDLIQKDRDRISSLLVALQLSLDRFQAVTQFISGECYRSRS
jgi:glycosyltransferase involved in cell wall biosynthesis